MSRESEKRVLVTGGAGFLGSNVVDCLKAKGYHDLTIPWSREFDLTRQEHVARLFETTKPNVAIHLAARVGGIGTNRTNAGRSLYDNTDMGSKLRAYASRRA